MADSLHEQINALVAREHELRDRLAKGEIDVATEHAELAAAEVQLDRLWDLLRQRAARREYGSAAPEPKIRPGGVVEDYLS